MIGKVLDQIRDYYLTRFSSAVREALCDPSVTVVTEAVLVNADGMPVPEGSLQLPLRNDLIILKHGAVTDSQLIDTKRMLSFTPVTFEWEHGLLVSLASFQWNWLDVRLHGLQVIPSWKPLQAWFREAFGDPFASGDGSGYLGVIHFMSDPVLCAGSSGHTATFSIDLGSAPVSSFESFLDAVAQVRPNSLELGHFGAA
jgi:hypothetical protein